MVLILQPPGVDVNADAGVVFGKREFVPVGNTVRIRIPIENHVMVKQQNPVKGTDVCGIKFIVFGFYQLLYELVHGRVLYSNNVVAAPNVCRLAAPKVFLFGTRHVKAAKSADDNVKVKIVQLVL